MSVVRFTLETHVPASRVLDAAVDFSDRRPDFWPNISRRFYRVHQVGPTWAEVTEGSDSLGGIWARERYDWSVPGIVTATVQDSNVFRPGGTWALRVQATGDGGSHLALTRDRRGRGVKGTLLEATLAVVGRPVLSRGMQQTLAILARAGRQPAVVAPPRGAGGLG